MNLPAEDELLGNLYVQNQMYEDAIKLFSALNKRDNSPQARANLAMAYAASGRTAEARRTLARAMAPNSAMSRRIGSRSLIYDWEKLMLRSNGWSGRTRKRIPCWGL